ncbi:unnamed protein product [Paramecium pentaurelia]|uniref:Uncharacterized protein n=1 Tax=Paramecium pentaurelia TaxID=43138 RepID=A0A8S1URI3_9CILI|nr:unnamed protein product [Paramecium pentaurelia]
MMSQLGSPERLPSLTPRVVDSILQHLGASTDHDNRVYQKERKRVRFEDSQIGLLLQTPLRPVPQGKMYIYLIARFFFNSKLCVIKIKIIKVDALFKLIRNINCNGYDKLFDWCNLVYYFMICQQDSLLIISLQGEQEGNYNKILNQSILYSSLLSQSTKSLFQQSLFIDLSEQHNHISLKKDQDLNKMDMKSCNKVSLSQSISKLYQSYEIVQVKPPYQFDRTQLMNYQPNKLQKTQKQLELQCRAKIFRIISMNQDLLNENYYFIQNKIKQEIFIQQLFSMKFNISNRLRPQTAYSMQLQANVRQIFIEWFLTHQQIVRQKCCLLFIMPRPMYMKWVVYIRKIKLIKRDNYQIIVSTRLL